MEINIIIIYVKDLYECKGKKRRILYGIDISQVWRVSKLENNNGQAKYKKCYVGN